MHLRCPHCQNPIELVDVPSSGTVTCAECGSGFHIDPLATRSETHARKQIGKFQILTWLGQGAFGSVFKARDTELDRVVAIKMPREGNVGSGPEALDRFLREARAVAQLRFPSIVSIHEVGISDGGPYLVCDFVEGLTVADLLTGRRLAFQESAQLIAEVADALEYAHSLGVVHRDVKPSNVMVRPDGSPCVMDFGLAKRDAGEITMTMDGQILGTPAYMSPEQARGEGHDVDGRSDVYSLGVMLYQLLTGELPFRGNRAMLLHQVLHEEPKPPRSLNDKIPRDLETIALKAIAKEPARRYTSAKAMADDLRRWLVGEPVLARPVGSAARLWRWCKRKPALATASATAILGALLALGTFAGAFFVVSESLEKETIERKKAESLADEKQKLAEAYGILAAKEAKARQEADERRERAEELALQLGFEHFYSKFKEDEALAMVGIAQLLPKAVKLKRQRLAHSMRLHFGGWLFATRIPKRILTHNDLVSAVALSADGKTALTGSWDKTARAWKTTTGKPIGLPLQHQGRVLALALSADGTTALTVSEGTAHVWDTTTGKPICPALQPAANVIAVALSADGKIAFTMTRGSTQVWASTTGKPVGPPLPHREALHDAALRLSADGRFGIMWRRASVRSVLIWETATGKPIGPPLVPEQDNSGWDPDAKGVLGVALSPDAKLALIGKVAFPGDKAAQLWDTSTGKPAGDWLRHGSGVWVDAVALSADGTVALTAGNDGTAWLWETATRKAIGPPLKFGGLSSGVALSADAKTVLIQTEKTAHLWTFDHLVEDPERIALWTQILFGMEVDESGNGRRLGNVELAERARRVYELGGPPFLTREMRANVALYPDVEEKNSAGLTSVEFRNAIEGHIKEGWRLAMIKGRARGNESLIDCTWERRPGPEYVVGHDMSASTFAERKATYEKAEFRLVLESSWIVAGESRYWAVWEKADQ